jgi:glycosyltransferase involved in cell wall biosynthesis
MHIAQFIQRYPPALGGSESYTKRLCEYSAACGDTVDVWTSDAIELWEMWWTKWSGSAAVPARERVNLRRYHSLRFPARRYLLKALSLFPHRFWQCLTVPCSPVCPQMWRDANTFAGPLDAVHAMAFPYSFPLACGLRLARRRGVPFLLTPFLHLGDFENPHDRTRRQYTKPHLRWLLRQADRVFVQTHSERATAIELGVPAERVVLQGQGAEPSECTGGDRDAFRAACGFASDEVVVGHLSNNSVEKGTVDLLRAAELAWRAGNQFRVVLAGPEMPNFQRFWKRFAWKERVTRLGVLSFEDKPGFFAGLDCFALPSRCDSFGIVLTEAWANAKPVLVYRAGGPAELVRHGIDGLQAKCGDVPELAAHLGRLVSDEGLRRRLGANGQPRVAAEFLWPDKFDTVRETIARVARSRSEWCDTQKDATRQVAPQTPSGATCRVACADE